MTIMILFLALAAAHYFNISYKPGNFWVERYNKWFSTQFPGPKDQNTWPGILSWISILALSLILILWLVENYLHFWFSTPLEILFLFFALGSQDLDEDVNRALHASTDERKNVAKENFAVHDIEQFEDSLWPQVVTKEALHRWFTPILWFVLLGPAAALVYRLLQTTASTKNIRLVIRLRLLMEWIPAQLMALSLAIVDNFSPVIKHWKGQRCPQTGKINDLECNFLYQAIGTAVDDTLRQAQSDNETLESDETMARLSISRQLIWRILFVWMTFIALLILLDIIP